MKHRHLNSRDLVLAALAAAVMVAGGCGDKGPPPLEEAEVGLPVYPGLANVGGSGGEAMEINGVTVTALPSIFGSTKDSMDEVVAFYTETLPGWNHREIDGKFYFWPGRPIENFDPSSPEVISHPLVAVLPSPENASAVVVQFTFEPPKTP